MIGMALSLNPREIYNQMYPVEALKRDAFRICHDTDPGFVRALEPDREHCFDSMPHTIALAIGWVQPQAALWAEALRDPARNAELLLALAALPLRQPVNAPRSFDNLSWLRALSPCGGTTAPPPTTSGPAPQPSGATVTLAANDSAIDRLVPVPRASQGGVAADRTPALVPLTDSKSINLSAPPLPGTSGKPIAAYDTLTTADVGDNPAPAIVPIAPSAGCRGGT
jgi:hypothetical protein